MATHTTTSPPPKALIRVLIAEDSTFLREVLGQLVGTDPALALVSMVACASDLIPLAARSCPDVIVAGPAMLPLGVRAVLDHLEQECEQTPQLVLCVPPSNTAAHDAIQFLADGATEAVSADRTALCEHLGDLRAALLRAIHAAARPLADTASNSPSDALAGGPFDLITITAGAGSLPALEHLLTQLPPDLPCPIIVSHTLPPSCVSALAGRLDAVCAISIHMASQGIPLYPGAAYILPGRSSARIRTLSGGPMRVEILSVPDPATAAAILHESTQKLPMIRTLGLTLTPSNAPRSRLERAARPRISGLDRLARSLASRGLVSAGPAASSARDIP